MADDVLTAVLEQQRDLNARLYGLTIAVSHLWAIEAAEAPTGAADRALGDVAGTVEGVARQLPDELGVMRDGVIEQLQRCLTMAAAQVERVKRQAPTSETRN